MIQTELEYSEDVRWQLAGIGLRGARGPSGHPHPYPNRIQCQILQQTTVSSCQPPLPKLLGLPVITIVCLNPHVTNRTTSPSRASTILGDRTFVLLPWPSWPWSPRPQVNTWPATERQDKASGVEGMMRRGY